ncbi:MAG: hypothetical protein WCT03_14960 [Candidatus Obscuribacterales bacterium]
MPQVKSTDQDTELRFFKDWKKSYALIFHAAKEAPIAAGSVIVVALLSLIYPKAMIGWLLLQTIAWLFLTSKLMRLTYCQIVPQAEAHPELFPTRPESNMFGGQWLFNVGTVACTLLLVLPGLWFATVHSFVQQIVVLEKCTVGEAFKRSRDLTKGNVLQLFGYVLLWPTVGAIVVFLAVVIVGIIVEVIGALTHNPSFRISTFTLEVFFTYFNLSVCLSCITLMVRAYVQFTHKSGSLTAIEKELAPEIAMQ